MKRAIFYFTGTGNSLYAAKSLKDKLDGDTDLISISKCIKNSSYTFNYENIGFSFPLYFTGIPDIVGDFIKRSTFKNVEYSFSLTTAGVTPGITHIQVESLLNKKGIDLNNHLTIFFTSNYIKKLKVASNKTINKKRDITEKKLINFARDINNRKSIRVSKMRLLKPLFTKLYNSWKDNLDSAASDFKTDNRCNSCEVCIKVCPTDNISIVNSKVTWDNKCQDCMACIHNCPKSTIQIEGRTESSGRYIHPDITLQEIINSNS